MNSNDGRGTLTRRFTTNALPTLSPIGQQRRQAAGDTHMVSSIYVTSMHKEHIASMEDGEIVLAGGREDEEDGLGGIRTLLADSEPSPGSAKRHGILIMVNGIPIGTPTKRGKGCWGAVGDGRPRSSVGVERSPGGGREGPFLLPVDDAVVLLTPRAKTSAAYARIAPVSLFVFFALSCTPAKTPLVCDQAEARHIAPLHVQPAASHDIKQVSWCSSRLQLPDCYLRSSPAEFPCEVHLRSSPEHALPYQNPPSDIHPTPNTSHTRPFHPGRCTLWISGSLKF